MSTEYLPTSSLPATDQRRRARRRLLGGAVGTFVEWYDFLIYGLTVPIFASQFFPGGDPTVALLSTFAIFGVGFVVRPLGGILFGYLGDRIGRIKVLAITIILMGAATGLIGLLPVYEAVGVLAPLLLLLLRLVQGFSTGGEHSGALSFVVESAPQHRRGFWIAIVYSVSILPGVLLGFGLIGLRAALGEAAYMEWGWRLPFFLGAVLAVVGLWLRLRLSDPEEFTRAREEAGSENPLKTAVMKEWKSLLVVLVIIIPNLAGYYFLVTYMYSFAITTVGVSQELALLSNTIASAVIMLGSLVGGRLADRVGRKPLMIAGAIWMALSSFPALMLLSSGTAIGVITAQLVVAVGVTLYVSGAVVTMLELFRTSSRYSAHGLSYGVGTAIFGGATPFVATWLASNIGPVAPAIILVIAGLLSVIVLFFTPETRNVNLSSGAVALNGDDEASAMAATPATQERARV
ncbi:MFS transporter [Agromyces sp. NPDC049794]|uniref:MFS transporter n=1 Tax=unclassified Agromyces TaxID=2639701 RepID=UPI0033F35747